MIKAPNINELTEKDKNRRLRVNHATEILTYKVWFEYLKATEIFDEFDVLYIQACNYFDDPQNNSDIRPINIFLSGEINTGKTTLVVKYINYVRNIAVLEGRDVSDDEIRYFETPVRVTFKRMFASILEEFGIPIRGSALKSMHTDVLINMLIKELRLKKVKLVFLDEIQNLLKANSEDKQDIFDGFKKLTNQSQTRIILVGTPTSIDLFRDAKWVDERFRVLALPRWKHNSKEWLDLLYAIYKAYEDFIPNWNLVKKDGKLNKNVALKLHGYSGGRLGKLIQTIQHAVVYSLLHNKNRITYSDYEAVLPIKYYVEDGKIFEKKKSESNKLNNTE